ncbi:MAG: prephenate dehydrogenase [Firmicutes bacterium]|nr:prephenate dehydrogenase [Bacillota bacterium]
MKIGIVGLGLMGGSIAKSLKEKYEIIAYDISDISLNFALENNIIDKGYNTVDEFFKQTNIIYLCLYPHDVIRFVKQYQDKLLPNSLLIDISGIKSLLIDELTPVLRDDIDLVYTHPIAGREKIGVTYADQSIFMGANYVIVPQKHNLGSNIKRVTDFARFMGFKNVSLISKEEHDEIIAYTSQLTHILSLSLVHADKETYDTSKFIGDSYRDLTRIAMINEVLWSELFLGNKKHLIEKISDVIKELELYKEALNNDDLKELKKRMNEAKRKRLLIESSVKK